VGEGAGAYTVDNVPFLLCVKVLFTVKIRLPSPVVPAQEIAKNYTLVFDKLGDLRPDPSLKFDVIHTGLKSTYI